MCKKTDVTCRFILDFVPNFCNLQELREKKVSEELFYVKILSCKMKVSRNVQKSYCFLSALKFVFDWFVTKKIVEKFDVVFSNDDIVFVDADFDNFTFLNDDMDLLNVGFNVSLDDDDFDYHEPKTIIDVRIMAWCKRHNAKYVQ